MATDAEILADMRNTIGTSYVLAAMRRAYQRNDLAAADAHGESLHRLLVVSWREDDENARRMVAAVLRAIRAEVAGETVCAVASGVSAAVGHASSPAASA